MIHRVVVDANVFASALIKPTGIPGKLVARLINDRDYQIILTPDIEDELKRILFYPKVRKYIALGDHEIEHWIDALAIVGYFFVPKFEHKVMVEEDPSDDCYLIAALESHAHTVVSGDRHLVKLNGLKNVSILTPKEFWSQIAGTEV